MQAFLESAFAFPTVVFTVALILFLIYALVTTLLPGAAEGTEAAFDADALDVAGVPLAILGGVVAAIGWLCSYFAMRFLRDTGGIAASALVAIVSVALGLWVGSKAVKPLRPLFAPPTAPRRSEIVGKVCTIRSLRVDEKQGTAEVEDGGAGFIAEVRCLRENELTIGSKAVVYEYDSNDGTYKVGPADRALTGDQSWT
jgi:hypothetical protein